MAELQRKMELPHNLADGLTEDDIGNLVFEKYDDASDFFYFYAAVKGFNLRKHDQRRRRSREIVMHKWICSQQGCTPYRCELVERADHHFRGTSRIGCEVTFKINKMGTSSWEVTWIALAHNHECIPSSQSCFMKDNRFLTEGNILAVEGMLSAGIRKCDIMRYFAGICDGNAHVGFTKGDLYNFCSTRRGKSTNTSDFDAVIAYLTAKKESDHGMTLTSYVHDGVVTRCYWADSRSRLGYMCFGDVVAIDSTFKTNSYGYLMILLVGVNHHHQTVVFGTALMRTESTKDYSWFMLNHVASMSGKMPVSIVSDSDKAIQAAISKCWPHVKHRLCLWHLQRNMARHAQGKEVIRKLNEFVYKEASECTMENKLAEFTMSFGLLENKRYKELYDSRYMWWGSYLKGFFWGELRSTQCCEGMHGYMKRFVNISHKLHEILHHFEKAVSDLRQNELLSDYQNSQRLPGVMTVLKKFEEHAAGVFTLQSFKLVQRQLKLEALYYASDCHISNFDRTYDITEYDKPGKVTKVFSILRTRHITCSCLHFETYGFPCGHIMHVAKVEGYREIPQTLILHRWTKKTKNAYCVNDNVSSEYGESIEDARRGVLVAACGSMCYLGSRSDRAYDMVANLIAEITLKLQSMSIGSDELHEMQQRTTRKRRLSHLNSQIGCDVFGDLENLCSMEGPVGNVSESHEDDGTSYSEQFHDVQDSIQGGMNT